jgi:hypothetical protein
MTSGTAIVRVVEAVIEKARPLAAEMLETAASDLVYTKGYFEIDCTDRRMSLPEIAARQTLDTQTTGPSISCTSGASTTSYSGTIIPSTCDARSSRTRRERPKDRPSRQGEDPRRQRDGAARYQGPKAKGMAARRSR